MQQVNSNFFQQIKNSKKVLILDLGFLGDTIHLLPAAHCVRKALPNAQLEVMVADHITSILECTPWIDKVLGYPRFPKGPKWYQELGRAKWLKVQNYDLVINLNGSDRSSFLTRATCAPVRFARLPQRKKWYSKFLFTHCVDVPYDATPVYLQRYNSLKEAGFPCEEPSFGVQIPNSIQNKVAQLIDNSTDFIHLSPFTTEDQREIPIPIMADFLNTLHKNQSSQKIAISCAPNDRERSKLNVLLGKLQFKPWRVWPGGLTLVQLSAVIQKSKLHLGGDSGALHIAVMVDTPTISWFYEYARESTHWLPYGPQHVHLIGTASLNGLDDVCASSLYATCTSMLNR